MYNIGQYTILLYLNGQLLSFNRNPYMSFNDIFNDINSIIINSFDEYNNFYAIIINTKNNTYVTYDPTLLITGCNNYNELYLYINNIFMYSKNVGKCNMMYDEYYGGEEYFKYSEKLIIENNNWIGNIYEKNNEYKQIISNFWAELVYDNISEK